MEIRRCVGPMLMLTTSLATCQYVLRPMVNKKFGFNRIHDEVLKEWNVDLNTATREQYKLIANTRLRKEAIDIDQIGNVSHLNNHLKIGGICLLGLFVSPVLFTKCLYVYFYGQMIFRINHLMFVKKGKTLFDFRKFEYAADIYLMGLQAMIAIMGVGKLLTRKKATDIVLKQ